MSLTPPVKKCDTKGAPKQKKASIRDNSTTREPSHWEHMDSQFPDSQASQSKPSRHRRKSARIGKILSPSSSMKRIP
ncbi:GDSL esterase/lipase, partial [Trifolium medium]|nr:GDSL esterase/lipase [Trifolium medium]